MIRFLVDLFFWTLEKLSCKETKPSYTTQKTNFEVVKTEQSVSLPAPLKEEEKPIESLPVPLPSSEVVTTVVEPDITVEVEIPVKQKRKRKTRATNKKTKKN